MSRTPARLIAAGALSALALGVLLGLAACSRDSEPPPASAAEATFSVEGMTCASCSVTVRTAAKRVDGVYDARADSNEGRAWASYDPQRTNPAAIASAITEAGYATTPLDNEHAATAPPTN